MLGIDFYCKDGKLNVCMKGAIHNRKFKGSSVNRHVDDYCIVDLETTGLSLCSASIIEISALKVRNNQVVDEFSTLVNPQYPIPACATEINHITNEMVESAPLLVDVIDDFLEFVGDDIILGYNNASFDMNLIYDSVKELRVKAFANDYLDMLYAVRRSLSNKLENAKLGTVCKYYGFDTADEHRALKDCYLTKACYDKLYMEFGNDAFKNRRRNMDYSCGKGKQHSKGTLELQKLIDYLEEIIPNEELTFTLDKVNSIFLWLDEHDDLLGKYPFDILSNAVNDFLEDGSITEQKQENLKNVLAEIVDPVEANAYHGQIMPLTGKQVCLTGEFEYGLKKDVEKLIKDAGGVIDKSIKKATDYLVVGTRRSTAWKAGNYGEKIQKAVKLQGENGNIKIVKEADFIPKIKNLIKHPDMQM